MLRTRALTDRTGNRKLEPMRSAAIFALALLPFRVQAGLCKPVSGPRHDFQLFAGYSPYSPTIIGTATNRGFVFAGLDYSYRCRDYKHVSMSFTAGAMPAAIVLQPAQMYALNSSPFGDFEAPAHAVYGFGITPLGGTFDFARARAIHPFLEFGLGLIASTEPVPENALDATGLNFLVVIGAGVQVRNISLGYKFVHISNAATTDFNPGLDNGVFYAGYSFVR
jgi:hypothetical protein